MDRLEAVTEAFLDRVAVALGKADLVAAAVRVLVPDTEGMMDGAAVLVEVRVEVIVFVEDSVSREEGEAEEETDEVAELVADTDAEAELVADTEDEVVVVEEAVLAAVTDGTGVPDRVTVDAAVAEELPEPEDDALTDDVAVIDAVKLDDRVCVFERVGVTAMDAVREEVAVFGGVRDGV